MIQQALMFLFAVKVALVTCNYEAAKWGAEKHKLNIKKLGKLDHVVNEASGICASPWTDSTVLMINDSGGDPTLFELDFQGKLVARHEVTNAKNKDWEEITSDLSGHVYIGDFGNNSNARTDLKIYKYKDQATSEIRFQFIDQKYNQKKEYDCEAFFWKNDSLFLFTKSWEKGVKLTRLYSVSDKPGDYLISPKDSISLKAQITGAAISPSAQRFALISYGKIFLFKIVDHLINFSTPEACIKIAKMQTEAIMFKNDSTLVFTNEQRSIFEMKL